MSLRIDKELCVAAVALSVCMAPAIAQNDPKVTSKRAYVISEVEVVDEKLADSYRPLAAASIAKHGGRYIVRGGAPAVVEGEPAKPKRVMVIAEFPSMKHVQDWYASPDYAEALKFRRALERRLMFVEGLPLP